MSESTPTPESESRLVAAVVGGELREVTTEEGVRREVIIDFPEEDWDDVVAAEIDELFLNPIEREERRS